jgi:hypothetical protein
MNAIETRLMETGPSALSAEHHHLEHPAHGAHAGFWRHFIEMMVVMMFSMALLGMPEAGVASLVGQGDVRREQPELAALVMCINMAVGMIAWMAYRKHSWPATIEMGAAMIVPALPFLALSWGGAMGSSGLGCSLMGITTLAMIGVILRRKQEYGG